MAGILSKSKARGVDFCGGYHSHYIIRSDLGCYMYSSDLHAGCNLTVYSIHPSCRGGDHYFADTKLWYIIKGNNYRTVTDLSNDYGAQMSALHPNCQGGDHYLCFGDYFFIIFQSRGVYRVVYNLTTDDYGTEYSLNPNYRDGLYYWGNSEGLYFLKPKSEWGVQFHKTKGLETDDVHHPFDIIWSIHPDVMNFLPGGLAETHGPAFGKWDLVKSIENKSDDPLTWEKRITRKVGYTWSKSSSLERNWKVSLTSTYQAGTLTEGIAKYQFSLTTEFGGTHVNTENQSWEAATEIEEKVTLTVQPHKTMYVWQYKLGFGKEDVLFCRDLVFDDDPNPPTAIPLPPSNN